MITVPHRYQPRTYQLPLLKALDSGVNRAVIVWNRRSGKDKTCFNYMVRRAVERVGTYFYFLPSYTLAKKVIWDNIDNDGFKMLDHIPKELIKGTNGTELKVELVNGSVIQLIAADEFKTGGVGTNPVGVVFSEYSITSPDAWQFVSPILAVNGGWAIFNFTPRGMNHAATLLQQAKDNNKWFWEVLTVNETKVMSDESLAEERKMFPQDFIEQEYFCKFIEGAGAFFRGVKDSKHIQSNQVLPGHKYKMGVDLGKHQDYTVITVLDLMTFNVVEIDRFNQIDWNLQQAKIEAAYLRYGRPVTTLDSTGLGDPIYDNLVQRGMHNLISFKFTEPSRKDLLTNLQMLLEQSKIRLPEHNQHYETLISELQSMRYEIVGERGKTKVMVPEGLHDDMIMSLALAVWEIPQNPLPKPGSLMYLTNSAIRRQSQTSFE